MAKGGRQPGAGRPKGSTNLPKIRDYFNEQEMQAFVAALKEKALTDPNVMKFVAEQIFGKAPQPLVGDPSQPLIVQFDKSFKT